MHAHSILACLELYFRLYTSLDIQTWHETSLDNFYMIGQLKKGQVRQLVYKHTIFLCAWDHISGYIQDRTFKLGKKYV